MVNSVTFDLKGEFNYISKRKEKTVLRKGKTIEKYEEMKRLLKEDDSKMFSERNRKFDKYRYRRNGLEDAFFKQVDDGLANPALYDNLSNKTINFSGDKVNVIFGPNASGKTTILKAIAANALCKKLLGLDGLPNPEQFISDITVYSEKDVQFDNPESEFPKLTNKEYINRIRKNLRHDIDFLAGNSVKMDWDGSLVYYENVSGRSMNSIDDFMDSIYGFGDKGVDVMRFILDKGSISMGQKSIYLINKLAQIASSGMNMKSIVDKVLKPKSQCFSDMEYATRWVLADYLSSKAKGNKKEKMTFLLDEIDKSLDFLNSVILYRDILPKFAKSFDVQLIVISHNPVVLSSICSSEYYNLISMNDEYTQEVRNALKGVTF